MPTTRNLYGLLLAVLLTVATLALPGAGQAYNWVKAVVGLAGPPGYGASIAVHPSGDILISYSDGGSGSGATGSLNYSICDISASAHGNCDVTADWKSTSVDSGGYDSSLAVGSTGDPMISYNQYTIGGVKFAICDISASAHGNCDQSADWHTVALGGTANRSHTSLTVDSAGNPMIAYYDAQPVANLRYAVCNISSSLNHNCDGPGDWKQVTVDPNWDAGAAPSIRVDAAGNVMISYWYCNYPSAPEGLRFAFCNRASSSDGWCDSATDWVRLDVDVQGSGRAVGGNTSLALTADGDPLIAYIGRPAPPFDLRFATCDISASAHGNCDHAADWRLTVAANPAQTLTNRSIAAGPSGHLVISYYDVINKNLKMATCQTSASVHGNCDQASDWATETVDDTGDVGDTSSVAVDNAGRPVISYYDKTNGTLKFASAAAAAPSPTPTKPSTPTPALPPGIGGAVKLPPAALAAEAARTPDDSGWTLGFYAALAAAVVVAAAMSAGGWYARRRWLR